MQADSEEAGDKKTKLEGNLKDEQTSLASVTEHAQKANVSRKQFLTVLDQVIALLAQGKKSVGEKGTVVATVQTIRDREVQKGKRAKGETERQSKDSQKVIDDINSQLEAMFSADTTTKSSIAGTKTSLSYQEEAKAKLEKDIEAITQRVSAWQDLCKAFLEG